MIVKKLSEAKPYEAPNHRAVSTLRVFGAEYRIGVRLATNVPAVWSAVVLDANGYAAVPAIRCLVDA